MICTLATMCMVLHVLSDGDSEVQSISVMPAGGGWLIGFTSDGRITAQFGSNFGDSARSPANAQIFSALLRGTKRLKIDTAGRCKTQVCIIKKGIVSHPSFFISDDTLFRYFIDAIEDRWEPTLPGSNRFRELLREYPIFPLIEAE